MNLTLKKTLIKFLIPVILTSLLSCSKPLDASGTSQIPADRYVIIYVWDGLRPDSVTEQNTPNLYKLMQEGTQFLDNHASYPTFTMMNAASFATGDRAGKTGFFGNTLWHPGLTGTDAALNPVDFLQPVFTEDYKILQALAKDDLFFVNTLFNAAHEKNLTTAAVGKSGPAFMQDYLALGLTLDEKHIHPLRFAKQVQNAGLPLPKLSPNDYQPDELKLDSNNGDPTAAEKINYLNDGVTPDASDTHGSPYNRANEYMVKIYFEQILDKDMPHLSVVWLRNPDSTEHLYGPGTFNYQDALRSDDKILGMLLDHLKNKNLLSKTDILIISDHAHNSVSGPTDLFPLRTISQGKVGEISSQGFSTSGEVRSAHLLTLAGFHAFDGNGCFNNPVLSGIKKDGTPLYPTQVDSTGKICGKLGANYITPAYKVPHENLPDDAIIVAANGGTDYFYIPSHNKQLVQRVVNFLASHKQYDAIFADAKQYGILNGTIPLETIGIENPQGRSPDIIAGFAYDPKTKIQGLPGIEFSDYSNLRGMHGSFSPIDVHNFMMAVGPDFKKGYKDTFPTGNVDLAPTVASILKINLPSIDGRVLKEALVNTLSVMLPVQDFMITSDPLMQLTIWDAANQKTNESEFRTELQGKILTDDSHQYYYFDQAKGLRH